MNENNTLDASSGQGQVSESAPAFQPTPDVASEQGTIESSQVQQPNQSQSLPPELMQELDRRTVNFNQKITEMGQQRSALEQQLAQMQQAEQDRNQRLAEALGIAQAEQQPDHINQFFEDPNYINNIIEDRIKSALEPVQNELNSAKTGEFLKEQMVAKEQIKQQLGEFLEPAVLEQVLDITNLVDPQIQQITQQLSDPIVTPEQKANLEAQRNNLVAQHLQREGGIEGLVHKNLGRLVGSNFQGIMQSGAKQLQQKQLQMQRAQAAGGSFMNGAGMQNAQGAGVGFVSESVSR